MNNECPDVIGGAIVIQYTLIDSRHLFTENTKQIVNGETLKSMKGLVICKYENEEGIYLFGCDADWNVITDTWHNDVEEAVAQAEFEYKNTKNTWIRK